MWPTKPLVWLYGDEPHGGLWPNTRPLLSSWLVFFVWLPVCLSVCPVVWLLYIYIAISRSRLSRTVGVQHDEWTKLKYMHSASSYNNYRWYGLSQNQSINQSINYSVQGTFFSRLIMFPRRRHVNCARCCSANQGKVFIIISQSVSVLIRLLLLL